MPKADLVTSLIAVNTNALHWLLKMGSFGAWVLVERKDQEKLHMFLASEMDAAHHEGIPVQHRRAVVAEIAKPRGDDEALLFVVKRSGALAMARVDRARIERELGRPFLVDTRNHLPMPWPRDWRGPYALDVAGGYRFDTPECQVLARVEEAWDYEDLDGEGGPRHLWRLEIGVTRAMDPTLASDEQIAPIAARFRHCGPWEERTHLHDRRHPSRRIFAAEVGQHREGETPWPEIHPLPEMLGPPPGWEPVEAFRRDRPIEFRIEGTKLLLEWSPPPGVSWYDAATGRASEPSRFALRTTARRKPTDEEASLVFAMLGGAAFTEVKGSRAAARGRAGTRVFRASAGWLRKVAGRA